MLLHKTSVSISSMHKKRVVFGITDSIAAYKSPDIANKLIKLGHEIQVIMTQKAEVFVTKRTLATITSSPIYDMYDCDIDPSVRHIELAKFADVFLIAPASADIIAKLANGFADDLLTSLFLTICSDTLIFIAPSMDVEIWNNPFVKQNIVKLKQLNNVYIIEPREGYQRSGAYGIGNMEKVDIIVDIVDKQLKKSSGTIDENIYLNVL